MKLKGGEGDCSEGDCCGKDDKGRESNPNCTREKQHRDLERLPGTANHLVHCWIRQETYFADFRRCLSMYETCFKAKGFINWKLLKTIQD
eukprot:6311439-Amphidinium_carterae.1